MGEVAKTLRFTGKNYKSGKAASQGRPSDFPGLHGSLADQSGDGRIAEFRGFRRRLESAEEGNHRRLIRRRQFLVSLGHTFGLAAMPEDRVA